MFGLLLLIAGYPEVRGPKWLAFAGSRALQLKFDELFMSH
jgi:hypothetical protein